MTPLAAALILTSACLHAGWNLVSKRRNPSLAYFAVSAVAAAVVAAPLLVLYRAALPRVPGAVWGLVAATGVAQAVYFAGLAGAYRRGDMSLAYPLARALPVVLVAAVSVLLGRGSAIAPAALAGMALITAGCIILPHRSWRGLSRQAYRDAVYLMALLAAVGTTAYTVIDDTALRHLRGAIAPLPPTAATLLFIGLQAVSTALLLGAATALLPGERARWQALRRSRAQWSAAALTGVVIMVAYGLVLAAMAYVSDVSYVAAFRQVSIPLGAVLGLTVQGEAAYRPKLAGIAVVTLGLLLVALG